MTDFLPPDCLRLVPKGSVSHLALAQKQSAERGQPRGIDIGIERLRAHAPEQPERSSTRPSMASPPMRPQGAVGYSVERPIRSLSQCEKWRAWLQCQPNGIMHKYNAQSWAFWHRDYWATFLAETEEARFKQWSVDEWVCWESKANMPIKTAEGEGQLLVSPLDILFTQDNISKCFGLGPHCGVSIDSTITDLMHGKLSPHSLPPLDVFQIEDKLYSINNRRLYVWKVAFCSGLAEYMTVNLRHPDDPFLRRKRPDHCTGALAEKWERHLTSEKDGLTVSVKGGSRYDHLQAPPPCPKWRTRL